MNRRDAILVGAAILAGPGVARVAADDEAVELLFVQTSGGVTLGDGKLTLQVASPNTLYFSDRPERIVGRVTTKDFVDHWASGDDSFKQDPPNAVLTADNGGMAEEVTVVLRDPRLEGGDLVYDVEILSGAKELSGKWASLFIDLIGRPLTPLSYAGVARRAGRRTARRIMWR
ncbi:hypothetical protein HPQ64_00120 [Rhizobiales bacterium]|uniref:hypothetical protein n=1 Tax=Hongsoonwoonella zoysiae TaxID=2821844 RepID=UPI00156000A1|nr:hypothetical protein [Hongsoonwoonella zoysiae]NRG16090.1 hypothetical protein [Hongsoonwoonella zoysiae]